MRAYTIISVMFFSDVTGLQTALNDKADNVHAHVIADVTGLQSALDNKSNAGHTHNLVSLGDVAIVSPNADDVVTWNGSAWVAQAVPTSPPQTFQLVNTPADEIGQTGDSAGMIAFSSSHLYMCISAYNGTNNIWKRIPWEAEGWSIPPEITDFGNVGDAPTSFEDYGNIGDPPTETDDYGQIDEI